MKLAVGVFGMGVVLLSVGFITPPGTQAVALPDPGPCCGRRGLGFVGGFLIGRHHGRYHGGGGCGGGCGWCGGCGRRKRSLDEIIEPEKIEEIYFKIASEDKDTCGLRLVCELAGRDPQYLTDEELTILMPYRGLDESNDGTYYGQYDKAVWHGQKGNPCHKLYPLCRYPAQIIMELSPNTTSLTD